MNRAGIPRSRTALWSVLFVASAGVALAVAWRITTLNRELPDYGEVPEFSLTERSGAAIARGDLDGGVWIADFIFTRCGGTCPLLTQKMAEVEQTLGELPLRFVSISVDPEYDTPDVLSAYADKYGADASRWLFLTGDKREVYALIQGGFHLGVEDVSESWETPAPATEVAASGDVGAEPAPSSDAPEPFIHSTRFVLVDHRGHIRGYYDALDEAAVTQLLRDSRRLIASTERG